MYVLIVYDVSVDRVTKVHKCLKQYLHWQQNSVFEGEISPARLEGLKVEIHKIIDQKDSILIYTARDAKWIKRESLGIQKQSIENFL